MKALILLKARLKSNLMTKAYLADMKNRGRLWVLLIALGSIIAVAAVFMMMLIQNYQALLSIGEASGEPEILILFASITSSVLIFFLAVPLCLSNIFYSRDNILAASLPVTTSDIVLSRMLSVYMFILPLHLFIIIPAAVIFLPASGSAASVISTILYSLTGPLFPLTAAMAAASLLAAAGDKSGYRTAFEIAGFLIAIILLGGLQISFSRTLISSGEMTGAAQMLAGYAEILKKIFFASAWTASGFTSSGWGYMAAGLAFSTASVMLCFLMLKKIKLNIVNRSDKRSSGRKHHNHPSESPVSPVRNSVTRALLKREWTVIKSSSAFLIEILGEVIILPILLVIFYFAIPGDLFLMVKEFAASFEALPLAVISALILIGSINSVSSTTISREGSSFSLSKALPLTARTQIKAKMIFHLILFLSSWYLNLIILYLILPVSAVHLLYLIPAGPAVVILEFAAAIQIDLSRPVLNWTHPQQAMKQNMNVLIGMGFGIIVAAVLLGPAAGLFFAGLNPLLIGLILTAEAVVADIILIPRILNYSDKRYIEISV